jgi:hypothetical protein
MSSNCKYCNKSFADKYKLHTHQKTAKYCIAIQNNLQPVSDDENKIELSFSCRYCNKSFTRKETLTNHVSTCYDKVLFELEDLREKFIRKEEEYKQKFTRQEEEYKELNIKYQETLEKLASQAIENTGNKTTNNIINNKNRIIQNLQPLTREHMQEQIQHLTFNNVKNGAHGIAHFASNYTFKDRIICSDVSRLNFIFKNEDDVIIKDPEGVEITKRFIEINREELLRLLEEYFNYIVNELEKDLDAVEYRYWAERREEVIATRSAVRKGNVQDNKEYYEEFRKNFLSALSKLVPR